MKLLETLIVTILIKILTLIKMLVIQYIYVDILDIFI